MRWCWRMAPLNGNVDLFFFFSRILFLNKKNLIQKKWLFRKNGFMVDFIYVHRAAPFCRVYIPLFPILSCYNDETQKCIKLYYFFISLLILFPLQTSLNINNTPQISRNGSEPPITRRNLHSTLSTCYLGVTIPNFPTPSTLSPHNSSKYNPNSTYFSGF